MSGSTLQARPAIETTLGADLSLDSVAGLCFPAPQLATPNPAKSARLDDGCGDGGPIDVGGMTDQAFTQLEFTPDSRVVYHTIESHPFNALGGEGTGDMLDNALVLFPDLPAGEIKPGHTWKNTHKTSVGGTGAKVDLEYEFTYEGDGACPSGAPSCAVFSFTGASDKDATVVENGITLTAGFGIVIGCLAMLHI